MTNANQTANSSLNALTETEQTRINHGVLLQALREIIHAAKAQIVLPLARVTEIRALLVSDTAKDPVLGPLWDRMGTMDIAPAAAAPSMPLGMLTDAELADLSSRSGRSFDRRWLELMIRHHDGGVAMADLEVRSGRCKPALALAVIVVTEPLSLGPLVGVTVKV